MLPEGWEIGRVSDLLIGLESGVSVNGEDRPLISGEKGVLKISAVTYGTFNPVAAKVITSDEELKRAKIHPKKGAILISRSNTEELVGASTYIEADYNNLFLPDKLWQTISKPSSNMKWLSYVLASDHSRYILSNLATGTSGSMKNITKGELLGLKISIPPLPEQRKIAQILTTWDKAIATTEQLLVNSQQEKKALMQQLLTGKNRLLDENGVRFSGEWDIVNLDSVCDVKGGKRLPKGSYLSENKTPYPYIRVADMFMGGVDVASIQYVPEDIAPSIQRYRIFKDDLFITVAGTLGIVGEIPDALDGANLTENADKLTNIKCDKTYLLYVMKSDLIQKYIEAESTQNAQPKLALTRIRSFKVPTPGKEEQQKIAAVLSTADQEITALQQKLKALKQEKKSLMQQLLTGKRRVKTEEAA